LTKAAESGWTKLPRAKESLLLRSFGNSSTKRMKRYSEKTACGPRKS